MADKKDDIRNEHISKDQFEFVQAGKRIFDKKFETKPIGYFKDAMIRFTKNKTNVFASIILGAIILLAIFVPIFSPKNAEVLEERVAFLPPRVPILEDWGIFDGHKSKTDQQVDMDTIDPETGIGLPATMDEKYIDMDTLENYWIECTDRDELCIGGQNQMILDSGSTHMSVKTAYLTFNASQETTITIDIEYMDTEDNSAVNIYMIPGFGPMKLVASFTEAGVYTFSPYDELGVLFAYTPIKIEFYSESNTNVVRFNSIQVDTNTAEEPAYYVEGYTLSQLQIDSTDGGAGSWVRIKGQRLMSSFDYDAYALAFGEKVENVFSKTVYDRLMVEYADVCIQSPDPDNPNGWLFSEGCPIVRVISRTESVWIDEDKDGIKETEYYNYTLVLNYAIYRGYEDIPYYIFGTTSQGKDLFKMIWIGARTSLILGLLVSVINISIGIIFGAISGYYGGTIDLIMQRFSEIMGRIPWLVSLAIFTALVGPGQTTLILVLIINGWIGIAAITRTQFYRYKGREYVLASRTLGAKDGRLIFRHILPNGIGTIITASVLSIPYVIFAESTLSYLGFGIGHGQSLNLFGFELTGASIGVLLNDGRNKMRTEPYLTMWPAIIISILMITFNMFGNALRDAFNPALRGSE